MLIFICRWRFCWQYPVDFSNAYEKWFARFFTVESDRMDRWKRVCHRLIMLDVSMCLVVWSNDSVNNIDPKIPCLEDVFLSVTTAVKDHFLALLDQRKHTTESNRFTGPFVASVWRIKRYYDEIATLQCRPLWQGD